MGYKKDTLITILLLMTLAGTMLLFAFMYVKPGKTLTTIHIGILAVLLIYILFYRFNKTNRNLSRFFESFHAGEGTASFHNSGNEAMTTLHKNLNRIMSEYQLLRKKAEQERFFYLNALHHTQTGLLIVDEKGNIRFSNRAIQRMLSLTDPVYIRKLEILSPRLPDLIMNSTPSHTEMIKAVVNNELIMLSMRCNIFRIQEESFRIVSLQDIKSEMEYNEAEAWQKLIRILTHEIMNSVSPITLTAAGIIQMLEKENSLNDNSQKERLDVMNGLEAIRKRSRGLATFVEGYQRINQLPQPVMTLISIKELFSQLEILLNADLQKAEIDCLFQVIPEPLLVCADEKLITQVLINLVRNAMFALENAEKKSIIIKAFQVNSHIRMTIRDTGKGIDPSMLDTIFIPFFTTRENGSGIGLSLSREIMKLHGGGIRVYSKPRLETTFTLLF